MRNRQVLALAHRGGARFQPNIGIENTAEAFRQAFSLGYRWFETDVHSSRDGVPYAFHDVDLKRLAGSSSMFAELDAAHIDRLRIRQHPIPRLDALLSEFPDASFNIDLKCDDVVVPTARTLRRLDAVDRVCIASFSHRRLGRFRRIMPEARTSCSLFEAAALRFGPGRFVRQFAVRGGASAAQVPVEWRGVRIITGSFVRAVHDLGLAVHAWTIDDEQTMTWLLDLGVDGIVSDRIDVLKRVLVERGQWTNGL
ncbi:glycerophosphodiester phosphodiesterase family protein [Saxibacter everestensis]|uniref:Glycerophosphodiester phosphodiesterase family protein n=1 Tax=Saxibacter everestensis TaxID=2909229 RepID=A0ABY8QXS5_9MICO|nr:glycerophosphodiester phosphodiesterase family protein [Brevibacteriaceae bacterium ZFBP1038]